MDNPFSSVLGAQGSFLALFHMLYKRHSGLNKELQWSLTYACAASVMLLIESLFGWRRHEADRPPEEMAGARSQATRGAEGMGIWAGT